MKPTDRLIQVMGAVAIIWYFVCLISLGFHPADTGTFHQFMSYSVTTLGATLATFVGMLLGIRQIARASAGALPASQAKLGEQLTTTSLQWWAAGLYLLSLFIAIAFWAAGNPVDPAIENLAKSLIGLVGGALTVSLNVR